MLGLHDLKVRWCVSITILVTLLVLSSPNLSYGQSEAETETVSFNIPSQTLPSALTAFARQAKVELVFAERGFDGVQTTAVVGSFEKERALELLLAGTGLRVGFGSGDSVIVQRADTSVSEGTTSLAVGDSNSGTVLLAQAAVGASQGSDDPEDADYQSGQAARKSGSTENPRKLEEVVVTGSRIRGAQSASPVVTITRQEIDQAGFATVEDIVENLPQNFGAGATSDATNADNLIQVVLGGNVQNFAGGTSVNLRGLGASSTLVLLNGRRLSPSGHEARFTNISSIPVSAIGRVEVMTDGASAIYGSDAIGGVINFILRENYDGAETRLHYGSDIRDGTSNVQFGQTFGNSWDDGNVLFTYEYYDSDALAAADRKFTASNDLSQFGGTDRRQPGGNPGNIVAGGQTFAIPAGQDGASLTAADFDLNTPLNFYNEVEFTDQTPNFERHSGFLHLTQNIGAVELFAQARFSSEDNSRRASPILGIIDFTVTGDDPATPGVIEGSPFFVDPTGTGLTQVTVDNYSIIEDIGALILVGEIESSGATLGARFEFNENWHGEFASNWSKEEATRSTTNFIDLADRSALVATASLTDPNLAFNPFGDGPNANNLAILEQFIQRSKVFSEASENELWSASFTVDGDLFEISGGGVKVATGIDFREESLFRFADSASDTPKQSRDVLAVYGEVFFPIISDSNSRTGLQQLELSLAARYEDYSDFGNSTNPKLGLLWSPSQSLALRGTIGSSYRAPALRDQDNSLLQQNRYSYFPELLVGRFGVNPFLVQLGGNENLRPEEATTWTVGFQWKPERIQGLSLDVTYFNVDFKDRIGAPVRNILGALTDPTLASLVTLNPDGNQIGAVVNSPRYDPARFAVFGGPFSAADLISGVFPVGAIIDARNTNTAKSVVTGADLQLSYTTETDLGSFNVGLNGSYLFDFEQAIVATDPLFEEVDTLGRPVDFRVRGNVTWSREGWAVTGYVNYTDGYTDQFSSPARAVDSWTTVDLNITYNTGNDAGFLSDTRLSLSAKNLFNEDPPFVDTLGGVGYDATNADPLGQFFSVQVVKEW